MIFLFNQLLYLDKYIQFWAKLIKALASLLSSSDIDFVELMINLLVEMKDLLIIHSPLVEASSSLDSIVL
jgi:hypothetical protein